MLSEYISKINVYDEFDYLIGILQDLETFIIKNNLVSDDIIDELINDETITMIIEKILTIRDKHNEIKSDFVSRLISKYRMTYSNDDNLVYLLDLNDDNIQILIKRNLNLVKKIASKFLGRGCEFEDLVSCGLMGLYEAILKFDPTRNCKFSTFAYSYIFKDIFNEVRDNGRLIRIPNNEYKEFVEISHFIDSFYDKFQRKPKIEELMKQFGKSKEDIQLFLSLSNQVDSLDRTVGDDSEKSTLGSFIPDPSLSVESSVDASSLHDELFDLFYSLGFDDEQIDILCRYYGINYNRRYSLDEIGSIYGVTRQRINQKIYTLLRRLRNSKKGRGLLVYIDIDPSEYEKKNSLIIKHGLFARFSSYEEKDIFDAVSKLPFKYRQIIVKRYGEKLDSDFISLDLSNSEKQLIYSVILNLIEKNLQDMKKSTKSSKNKSLIDRFSKYDITVVKEAISYLSNDEILLLKQRYGEDFDRYFNIDDESLEKVNSIISKLKKIISKVMKNKRSDFLRSDSLDFSSSDNLKEMVLREDFLSFFETLPIREKTVCSLVFGYTGEYINTLDVAGTLGISIVDVNKIIIDVIKRYCIAIDSSFDEKTLYVKKKSKK